MRALSTAATGMMAMELNVQVISNNLANMTTTGYKRQRAEFQDLLYDHVSRVGTQTSSQGNILPVGIDLGSGVKTVGTGRLMSQGSLTQTGNPFDVAIRGDGFFNRRSCARWRHVNHRGVGAGFFFGLGHRVEHRQIEVGRATFAGADAAGHLGAVGDRLFGVEGAVFAGEALANDARGGVDENGQRAAPKNERPGLNPGRTRCKPSESAA